MKTDYNSPRENLTSWVKQNTIKLRFQYEWTKFSEILLTQTLNKISFILQSWFSYRLHLSNFLCVEVKLGLVQWKHLLRSMYMVNMTNNALLKPFLWQEKIDWNSDVCGTRRYKIHFSSHKFRDVARNLSSRRVGKWREMTIRVGKWKGEKWTLFLVPFLVSKFTRQEIVVHYSTKESNDLINLSVRCIQLFLHRSGATKWV